MTIAAMDLFGTPARVLKHPGAYAAMPGTGPDGKCCRDCAHYRPSKWHDRIYRKCGLIHATNGAGTDILATAPACKRYEEPK